VTSSLHNDDNIMADEEVAAKAIVHMTLFIATQVTN